MPAKKKEATIEVLELKTKTLDVHIVGDTPLVYNAMSRKVREGLLFPAQKKSRAVLNTTLKHDPIREYRESVYRSISDDTETLLVFPGGGLKKAIAQAAIDIPGAAKAQIGRLSWVNEWNVSIWGIPQLLMSVVRMADVARTPDVRTRAVLPEWGAKFSITFATPQLNETTITRLTAAAGIIVGVGDWRTQKGSGNFGQFRIVDPKKDAQWKRIIKTGGREPQVAALENPTCFDHETESLLEWFKAEAARREFKVS
jgi:hypothetical protein